MNLYAWVLLAALAAAALADWVAVATGRRGVELLAKPAYIVLLAAFAWLLHAEQTLPGTWVLAALGFSLAGDVLLLVRSDRAFGYGLLAFLSAHLCYLGAVLTMPRADPVWLGVLATALVVVVTFLVVLWPLVREDVGAGLPPTGYALVLGSFVALAWWSGNVLVGVGASLFLVSDAVLAANRFWREVPGAGLVVMVTYHVAQLLIVLGVLRPDLAPV